MSMSGVDALSIVTASEDLHRVPGCVKNLGIPIGPDHHCGAYWDKYLDGIERERRKLFVALMPPFSTAFWPAIGAQPSTIFTIRGRSSNL
jgi:hypothetical protein